MTGSCIHAAPRRLRGVLLAAASALALGARPVRAQELPPLVLEPRGGASVPIGSFRTGPDAGGALERAPSFGMHFIYRSPAGWGPYVGFSQHRFGCAADGCPGGEYVATSWDVGAQRTLGLLGWARAGLVFARLERDFEVEGAALRAASSLSLGVEGGAGVRVPLRGRLSLTPGVRFGWLDTRFPDDGLVRMRWVAADVGLAIGF